MYCIKCGAVLAESAKFCSKCGTAVNTQTSTVQTPLNPAQPVRQNAFTFISMGITAVMALLFFLPAVAVNGKSFSMFTSVISAIELDIVPFTFCALLMCAAEVILILAVANLIFYLISRKIK